MDFIKFIFELLKKLLISFGIGKESAGSFSILLLIFLFFVFFFILAVLLKRKHKKEDPEFSEKTKILTPFEKFKDGMPPPTDGRYGIRKFSRIDMEIEASFTTDNHPEPIPCLLKDISLSGLGFFSNSILRKGLRIRMNIPSLNPDSKIQTFTVTGELVRITPIKDKNFDYGIHFFHVFKKEEDLILYLIEKFKGSSPE